MRYPFLCSALILVGVLVSVLASKGDERAEFGACVRDCLAADSYGQLSLLLRVTGWTRESNCRYDCMRRDVETMRLRSEGVLQYYGKWPFIRVFGAQEIFSVVFSLGNLVAHIYGFNRIYKGRGGKFAWLHRINYGVACNTWLQSAIFHYRDLKVTERLDYFSACACIVMTLSTAIIVTLCAKSSPRTHRLVLAAMLAVYVQHICYMSFVDFDYGYNVKFNAALGVLTKGLWMRWIWKLQQQKAPPKLVSLYIRFILASALSFLMVAIDFPPFFDHIDMHALWHLSTIPLTLQWYGLITTEAELADPGSVSRSSGGRLRKQTRTSPSS